MRKLILSALSMAAAAFTAPATIAGEESDWEFSANVALSSDYVWRGISQTDESPAISGGFDVANGSFYAGSWASNVDFGDDASIEIDVYAGFASEFANGIGWDVGVIYYAYPDSTPDYNFVEIYAGLSYEFEGGVGVGASVAYDPDNKNTYVEATAGYSFENFSIDGAVGNYSFDAGGDYTQYNLGVTIPTEWVDLDLRVWDNDANNDTSLVATISRSF